MLTSPTLLDISRPSKDNGVDRLNKRLEYARRSMVERSPHDTVGRVSPLSVSLDAPSRTLAIRQLVCLASPWRSSGARFADGERDIVQRATVLYSDLYSELNRECGPLTEEWTLPI